MEKYIIAARRRSNGTAVFYRNWPVHGEHMTLWKQTATVLEKEQARSIVNRLIMNWKKYGNWRLEVVS